MRSGCRGEGIIVMTPHEAPDIRVLMAIDKAFRKKLHGSEGDSWGCEACNVLWDALLASLDGAHINKIGRPIYEHHTDERGGADGGRAQAALPAARGHP